MLTLYSVGAFLDHYFQECREGRMIMDQSQAGDMVFFGDGVVQATFTHDRQNYMLLPRDFSENIKKKMGNALFGVAATQQS